LDLGSYSAVALSLKELCDKGQIRRLARGLYDYPRTHPKLGDLSPTPEQIAQALADKDSSRIQPSGAYAANLLGLSEQVPAKVVFLTDATDRRVSVGRQEIILKRTTPKNMATAGRISGLVIQALRHLGKDHVDDAVVDKLARRLSADDRRQLMKDIRYAPAWIGGIIRGLAEGEEE
jgi:predicted transcriptional regulator of viral defense system